MVHRMILQASEVHQQRIILLEVPLQQTEVAEEEMAKRSFVTLKRF